MYLLHHLSNYLSIEIDYVNFSTVLCRIIDIRDMVGKYGKIVIYNEEVQLLKSILEDKPF